MTSSDAPPPPEPTPQELKRALKAFRKRSALAEFPKLSREDRRRLLERILELEEEAASVEALRRTAEEPFLMLDAMEADILYPRGAPGTTSGSQSPFSDRLLMHP